jgi:hypothetical protein
MLRQLPGNRAPGQMRRYRPRHDVRWLRCRAQPLSQRPSPPKVYLRERGGAALEETTMEILEDSADTPEEVVLKEDRSA